MKKYKVDANSCNVILAETIILLRFIWFFILLQNGREDKIYQHRYPQ